jgi:hypothetical protein
LPFELILQILTNTPPWVFVLFLVLLGYGWLQTRTRTIGAGRLALLPLIMIGLSLTAVSTTFGAKPAVLGAWAGGGALAIALIHGLMKPGAFATAAPGGRITMTGSWLPLALMMTIFFTRYAVTVLMVFNRPLRQSAPFAAGIALLYGFLSGLFLARALLAWRAARLAP